MNLFEQLPPYITYAIFMMILLILYIECVYPWIRYSTRKDERVTPYLQRQLDIAHRNAVAHSFKPDHERLPARMRIRLMKYKRLASQEAKDLESVEEKCAERKGGKRVRFADEERMATDEDLKSVEKCTEMQGEEMIRLYDKESEAECKDSDLKSDVETLCISC